MEQYLTGLTGYLWQHLFAAFGITLHRAFGLAGNLGGVSGEALLFQVANLATCPIPAVFCLRVQLLIDCFAASRLPSPISRVQLCAANALCFSSCGATIVGGLAYRAGLGGQIGFQRR